MPETMKLLESTDNKITKDKNGENSPHLEIKEVILVHWNIVNNDYQQDSRISYTFVPNKLFGQLLEISPASSIFSKTFNLEFSYIEVLFTDQSSNPLEIEDRINLTLIIIKIRYPLEPKDQIYVRDYGFLSFAKNFVKNLSGKYGEILLDNAKKSTKDALKTTSKRAAQKTAEATGDLFVIKLLIKLQKPKKLHHRIV